MVVYDDFLSPKPSGLGLVREFPWVGESNAKWQNSRELQRKPIRFAGSIGRHVSKKYFLLTPKLQRRQVHCQLQNRNLGKIHICLLMEMWDGAQTHDTLVEWKSACTNTVCSDVVLLLFTGNSMIIASILCRDSWQCSTHFCSRMAQRAQECAGFKISPKTFSMDHTKMCVSLNLSMEVLFGIYWNWGKP